MTKFSKADVLAARMESDACFAERIAYEMKDYQTMTADEAKIADGKCHELKLYYAHVSDDTSFAFMMNSKVDFNFINTKGQLGKYVAKKVYEFAEFVSVVGGKLDMYDLVVFRTLLNFTNAGIGATRDQLKASIDHNKAERDELVFRVPNFRKGTGTSAPQHGSSLASFKAYGMIKSVMCADTGNETFALNMEAFATKALLARLGLNK